MYPPAAIAPTTEQLLDASADRLSFDVGCHGDFPKHIAGERY